MRNVTKLLLTAGLAVAFVSLALAQRPGGGQFKIDENTAILNADVQAELKLTDAQKEKLAKITDKMKADSKKAFEDKDFQALGKIREEASKSAAEVVKDLNKDQTKRLKQITLQAAQQFGGLSVYAREDVATGLKLTDKQKEMIKKTTEDTAKDVKELFENAGKDKDKLKAAREKVTALNKEAADKIGSSLTDDQKKAWKDMVGDKYEKLDTLRPGGRGPKKDAE